LMLITVSVVVPLDPCPIFRLAWEDDRVKSPRCEVGFEFRALASSGSAMNTPTTDPSARIPTRKRDQTGTVLLTAEGVDPT